jgi:hypothetical protein
MMESEVRYVDRSAEAQKNIKKDQYHNISRHNLYRARNNIQNERSCSHKRASITAALMNLSFWIAAAFIVSLAFRISVAFKVRLASRFRTAFTFSIFSNLSFRPSV